MKKLEIFRMVLLTLLGIIIAACGKNETKRIILSDQGSFAVGGVVITSPGTFDPYKPTVAGQTFHGDHAYVFYQIPENQRKLPLVFWHGAGQSSKTWETTPDGLEGFQTIFLRRRFAVYVIDQPRRGQAGRSTVESTIKPTPDEQALFDVFRFGVWPDYFTSRSRSIKSVFSDNNAQYRPV